MKGNKKETININMLLFIVEVDSSHGASFKALHLSKSNLKYVNIKPIKNPS